MYNVGDWVYFRLSKEYPCIKAIILFRFNSGNQQLGFLSPDNRKTTPNKILHTTDLIIKEEVKAFVDKGIINASIVRGSDDVYINVKGKLIKTLHYNY